MIAKINPGDWLGDYQVEACLRAGGMATLFRARRIGAAGFSRVAAIKIIHPHLSHDEHFIRMFVDEARISSRISHPNVVHVEEFGEEAGQFFLVMEYVDGCSAAELITKLQKAGDLLDIELAAHIAFQIAEGLHAAHETLGDDGRPLDIVHRDISPSNVLLSRDGNVKIIDFGIAKARGRIAMTETGRCLKGKLRYMSPEHVSGRSIDRRSDIYAVGVVLWELLTAERAFDGDNEMAVFAQVRDSDLRAIRGVRPDVPEALAQVIERATARDPAARPATAYELGRLIASAVPGAMLIDKRSFGRLIDAVSRPRPPTFVATVPIWPGSGDSLYAGGATGSLPGHRQSGSIAMPVATGSRPPDTVPDDPRGSSDSAAASDVAPVPSTPVFSRSILIGIATVAIAVVALVASSVWPEVAIAPPRAVVAPALAADPEPPDRATPGEHEASPPRSAAAPVEHARPAPVRPKPPEPAAAGRERRTGGARPPARVARHRAARSRSEPSRRRPAPASQAPAPEIVASPERIGGVTIMDEDRGEERSAPRRRADRPRRAGDTPIAEGFDE